MDIRKIKKLLQNIPKKNIILEYLFDKIYIIKKKIKINKSIKITGGCYYKGYMCFTAIQGNNKSILLSDNLNSFEPLIQLHSNIYPIDIEIVNDSSFVLVSLLGNVCNISLNQWNGNIVCCYNIYNVYAVSKFINHDDCLYLICFSYKLKRQLDNFYKSVSNNQYSSSINEIVNGLKNLIESDTKYFMIFSDSIQELVIDNETKISIFHKSLYSPIVENDVDDIMGKIVHVDDYLICINNPIINTNFYVMKPLY